MAELFDQDSEHFSTVRSDFLVDRTGRKFDYLFDLPQMRLVGLTSQDAEYTPDDPIWKAAERALKEAHAPLTVEYAMKTAGQDSFAIHEGYRPGVPRNAAVRKYLGVAHNHGAALAFSSDQNKTFVFLCQEGWALDQSPATIDSKIAQFKSYGDSRAALVVVEGSLGYCLNYQRSLRNPDFVVFCANEAALQEMGVQILDAGFNGAPGSMGSIDTYLFAARRVERKREGGEDAAIPSGPVTHPPTHETPTSAPPAEMSTPETAKAPPEPPGRTQDAPPVQESQTAAPVAPEPVQAQTERPQQVAPRQVPERSHGMSQAMRGTPPVRSGASASAKQVTRIAAETPAEDPRVLAARYGMGEAPGQPMGAGSGGRDTSFEAGLQANVAAVLGGQAEVPDMQSQGSMPITAGMTVRETAYGTLGVVETVEGEMANVRFEDASEAAYIPISELRVEG